MPTLTFPIVSSQDEDQDQDQMQLLLMVLLLLLLFMTITNVVVYDSWRQCHSRMALTQIFLDN